MGLLLDLSFLEEFHTLYSMYSHFSELYVFEVCLSYVLSSEFLISRNSRTGRSGTHWTISDGPIGDGTHNPKWMT